MALYRGFKREANQIAREVRGELGLRPSDALNAWALAEYLEIPVLPLSYFRQQTPDAASQFLHVDRGAFSALTVFDGPHRLIVYNDSHVVGRQASDLAHELAHALLLHRPESAFDACGCRRWNGDQEDEANWLAAALLISEEAALQIVRSGQTVEDAARIYGVSPKMISFRVNVTGAQKRVGSGTAKAWRQPQSRITGR